MAEKSPRRREDRSRDDRRRDGDRQDDRSRNGRSRADRRRYDDRGSDDGRDDEVRRDDRQRAARSGGAEGRRDGHADSQRSIDAGEVARRAMGQVMELTGRDADVVTSIERTDDGWRVGVEIIEIRRVPDTADILATYEVELDGDGRLLGYRRVGRYSRSQVDREGP